MLVELRSKAEAAEMMQRVTDGGSVSVDEMERWSASTRTEDT